LRITDRDHGVHVHRRDQRADDQQIEQFERLALQETDVAGVAERADAGRRQLGQIPRCHHHEGQDQEQPWVVAV
jgi:hypothetical protein